MSATRPRADAELVDLLRDLIRNACVNDGTIASGQEVRNAATLATYLTDLESETEFFESAPGRVSLVTRIAGSEPGAASLCLMGHTDVVPATAGRWSVDPFEARVIDGVVWGRGALDMLNQTAAMAAAVRDVIADGFRPRGDLVFLAVADEEAGGRLGAEWLLQNHRDAVECDYVITEGGGFLLPSVAAGAAKEPAIGVMVAEKGPMWRRLHFHGAPGHASIPAGSDNALAKAADALSRLNQHAPPARVTETWTALVDALELPGNLGTRLLDPDTVDAALDDLAESHPVEARIFYSCTHDTFAANVARAGSKINVTAADAYFELDARVLPGVGIADLDAELEHVLGEHFDPDSIEDIAIQPATASATDTPLWPAMADAAADVLGAVHLVPWLTPFATDARFFRMAGAVGYGITLHDETVDLATWLQLFHGDDERVSIEALGAARLLYDGIIRRFLG